MQLGFENSLPQVTLGVVKAQNGQSEGYQALLPTHQSLCRHLLLSMRFSRQLHCNIPSNQSWRGANQLWAHSSQRS